MLENGHEPASHATKSSPEAEALAGLLHDLADLRDYLAGRGQHTYELAQRFLHSAQRQSSESAYDERQATMLEYQHYIWHEIAGRVDQLLARYGDMVGTSPDLETPGHRSSQEER
jgi:hypothetical protein